MEESQLIPHYMKAPEHSTYHDICTKNALPPGGGDKPVENRKDDVVSQNEIWKQAVTKETNSVKEWQTNWGFLADYDDKGNKKEAKALPGNLTVFSDSVPNTNSGNYGSNLGSDLGQHVQDLEFRFYAESRRRKLPSDMVCY